MSAEPHTDQQFMRRAVAVAGLGVLVAGVIWFIWLAVDGLLLILAAIILAIGLDGLGRLVHRLVPISRRLSVALATLFVLIGLGGVLTVGALNIRARAPQLQQQISQSINQISKTLENGGFASKWLGSGDQAKNQNSGSSASSIGKQLTSSLSDAASITVNTLADTLVVMIIGFYLAFQPELYKTAVLRLWPPNRREQAEWIASESGQVIRRWLVGRGLSMLAVGVGSSIGLSFLNLPFALLLGLIAGLLTFIPYLGAILSSVPALLIAALSGLDVVFYVAGLYLGLHAVEGYVLSPLIQKRAVSLAPGFLLIAQVIGIAIAGVFGMMVATPTALICEVIVQTLYVQDVIGEKPNFPT